MANRGISIAETSEITLKTDPAHPDNIEAEVQRRLLQLPPKKRTDEATMKDVRAAVEKEAGPLTTYIVGPLTFDDRIELGDLDSALTQSAEGMRMTMRNTERSYTTVQRALKGWRNFLDEKDRPIDFQSETMMHKGAPRMVASQKSVSSMKREDVFELAKEISMLNGMRSDLEKKLESLSTQFPATVSATGDAQTKNVDQKSGDDAGVVSPAS